MSVAQTCNSREKFCSVSGNKCSRSQHKQNSHKMKMYWLYAILMDFYLRTQGKAKKKCNNCRQVFTSNTNVVMLHFQGKTFPLISSIFEKFSVLLSSLARKTSHSGDIGQVFAAAKSSLVWRSFVFSFTFGIWLPKCLRFSPFCCVLLFYRIRYICMLRHILKFILATERWVGGSFQVLE